MSEAISVRGLTKVYGGKTIVDHLDLSVKSGTVFGLLGANGAGKSTTIECWLGTKKADEGTVLLLGGPIEAPPRAVPTHRRAVSGRRLSQRNQGVGALRGNGKPVPKARRLAEALCAVRHRR